MTATPAVEVVETETTADKDQPVGWGFERGDEIVESLVAMKLLGGGSAYEAYVAFDEVLLAPVVVKIVRPDQVDDESTLHGLRREIRALERVEHPAVVRYFHADTSGPRPYVVLENIDGPRLSSLIRKHGHLPVQQLLPLALEISSALHYLQHRDVCHLDVKPSNVIMGSPARLIDLSVARSAAAAAELDHVIGTDDYMAPEQCVPGQRAPIGHAADVWGLGTTLFHAAAGYRAFDRAGGKDATTDAERYPQLVDKPYSLPHFVDGAVGELVLWCLEADPADRPTPLQLHEAVEPLMSAMPKARLSGFKISAH